MKKPEKRVKRSEEKEGALGEKVEERLGSVKKTPGRARRMVGGSTRVR